MRNFYQNMKALLLMAVCCAASATAWADGTRTTYTFTVNRTIDQTDASVCEIHPAVTSAHLNCGTLATALTSNSVKLWAIQATSGKFYGSYTNGTRGFCFTKAGVVTTSTNKKIAIKSVYDSGKFELSTVNDMLTDGETYVVKQAFVCSASADTVEYDFNIVIGTTKGVTSDEPAFNHRSDLADSWLALPYVQKNDQGGVTSNCLQVNAGDRAIMGLRTRNDGDVVKFSVKNSAGKTVKYTNANDYEIAAAEPEDAGYYTITCRYKDAATGTSKTQSYMFVLDVQTNQGENYDWAANTPTWSYDFRDEYPEGFAKPTKVLNPYGTAMTGYKASEWWCVEWGKLRRQDVTDEAIEKMLVKFNEDFGYIREEMGWPPDKRARNGYYSTIVYFNSGLTSSDTTATGGWQGTDWYEGENWPNVLVSYYPIRAFDSKYEEEWQQEAMIHEGIHAVFADMEGVKNSAWFHEGGNTWLQSAMNAKRDGTYGTPGYLDACPFMAPFMPIECYSGWLQDGSFGGPSAEGVNMYNSDGKQVCTWRNMLGGTQYGNGFAIFLGEAVGQGSIPWIWRYCKNRVLQGIAEGNSSEGIEGIGEDAMRSLIMQYRAKQATFDLGGWSKGYREVVNNNFGGTVKAEWSPYWINCDPWTVTPYAAPTLNDADGWLAPDTITNPGWSGGNQIPIHVEGNSCTVEFRPEDLNMRAQLCYRTKSGDTYYSQPALCGDLVLNWDSSSKPANDVVFCVVANTDYIYESDATRKKHFDYRIRLKDGATAVASKDIRWYFWEQTLKDEDYETGIEGIAATGNDAGAQQIRLVTSLLRAGGQVQFELNGANPADITAELVGISGVVINQQPMSANGTIQLPASLPRGLYVLALKVNGQMQTFKMYVE